MKTKLYSIILSFSLLMTAQKSLATADELIIKSDFDNTDFEKYFKKIQATLPFEKKYTPEELEKLKESRKNFLMHKSQSKNGDTSSTLRLAYDYIESRGTTKNVTKALNLLNELNKLNDITDSDKALLLYHLASIYHRLGHDQQIDIKRALQLYNESGELGGSYAYEMLAHMYYRGNSLRAIGQNASPEKYIDYLLKAAQLGSNVAVKYLIRDSKIDPYKSLLSDHKDNINNWQKRAIEQNNIESLYLQYQSLIKGLKLIPNSNVYELRDTKDKETIAEAIDFCQQAAKGGHQTAILKLGTIYSSDVFGNKDMAKAIFWYEQGTSPEAYNELFWIYHNDPNFKDLTKAYYYANKSAHEHNAIGQRYLALCYEEGLGCDKDLNKAFIYLQKSANRGIASSIKALKSEKWSDYVTRGAETGNYDTRH